MDQSRTKAKVTFVALCVIIFVCILLALGVILIHFCDKYNHKIALQDKQIEALENAKDYYGSDRYIDNSLRDNNYANPGDMIFEEE